MDLRFLTKNQNKADEFEALFKKSGHKIVPVSASIDEIQTEDMEALVRDKVIKAFSLVRRPIFVDHTGLHFDYLEGLPGGLTETFWNRLKNDKLASMIGKSVQPKATAVTLLAYCDGTRINVFKGEIAGTIAPEPRGPEGFQWDPIFIPDGQLQTFAQMGNKKNLISMRRLAVDKMIAHLESMK